MSEIYTVIVGILGILAVSGLFVGVTNDAVNFLNSAIGSKAASMKIILTVASVGIIIGVVTSSGMMEVARSGMFNPGLFTFHEVMMLYLGVSSQTSSCWTSTFRGDSRPRPPYR